MKCLNMATKVRVYRMGILGVYFVRTSIGLLFSVLHKHFVFFSKRFNRKVIEQHRRKTVTTCLIESEHALFDPQKGENILGSVHFQFSS